MRWYPEVTMGGGTADHFALAAINKSIDGNVISKIESGERIEIVIEITDGDTCDPGSTQRELKKLERKGVLTGAINLAARRTRQTLASYAGSLESQADSAEQAGNRELSSYYRRMITDSALIIGRNSIFEQIWNSGEFKRGLHVSDPAELPQALSVMIRRFIDTSLALREIDSQS